MKILSAALFCVLLTAQTALAQASAPASAPAAKQDPTVPAIKHDKDGMTPNPGFMTNHEKFVAQAKQGGIDLLFLGDSITAGLGGRRQGRLGEALRQAQRRQLRHRRRPHAARAVAHRERRARRHQAEGGRAHDRHEQHRRPTTAEQIAEGVTKIVEDGAGEDRREDPAAGRLPRASEKRPTEGDAKPPSTREDRDASTRSSPKLDDGKNVRYLDLEDKFLQPDGTISKEIMPDFLHLTPAGYEIWAEAMDPLLTEMMGQ